MRHKKALGDLSRVFALRKALPDDHARYIRFNSKGRYRWCAGFVSNGEYFNWPNEVKYREHIAMLKWWINEIDIRLTEYRKFKVTEV